MGRDRFTFFNIPSTKMAEPIRVVVTGAAGQIAYSLLYQLAKGDVFGADQPLSLHLLDIEPMMGVLGGVVMELQDCALPLLREVIPTADPAVGFKDVDAAFLVGAMPRREGMERKDLLAANVKIFKAQGQALDQHAKKTVKVLVVGNPANTNALICSKYAPSIPPANFSAMTRLDQNRAQAQIANRLGVAVNDDAWLAGDFVSTVQKRGAAVIAARKLSSAMSAAKAAADHMRDWWNGTPEDTWVSMGVFSDGSYNTPAGIMFSFPVRCSKGTWTIVQGLSMDEFACGKLELTATELTGEREEALSVCQD